MDKSHKPGSALKRGVTGDRLFNDWIDDNLPGDLLPSGCHGATAEINRFLATTDLESQVHEPAPFFSTLPDSMDLEKWMSAQEEALWSNADRVLLQRNIRSLKTGKADTVITGQQPGFMGGPLYTLYKIATTIAAAKKRTLAGRLTIPVFWSGDDDDDLLEALSALCWDPANNRLVRHELASKKKYDSDERVMTGSLSAAKWSGQARRWLASLKHDDKVISDDLAMIWKKAVEKDWDWSSLQRKSVLRIFTGTGLMVVHGRDPLLHKKASEIYRSIMDQRDELAQLVRSRGELLQSKGWTPQISERSIANNLFLVKDNRRQVLPADNPDILTNDIRPGVMFRSLVQDYLFKPAAVVVGPGELAYLRQLDPLYKALNVSRSPLLPRLFAWLVPEKFDPELLTEFYEARTDQNRIEKVASDFIAQSESDLRELLVKESGISIDRSTQLARQRTGRWKKGLTKMMLAADRQQKAADMPKEPLWVFPAGNRQERSLAMICAVGLCGQSVVEAALEAAENHLESGSVGQWSEYLIEVSL